MAVFIMSAATLADLHGRRRLYLAGIARVHRGVDRLRARADARRAQRRARRAGRGGGDRQRHVARAGQRGVSRSQAKARAIGIWTAIASVGTAVGPTLGGFLVEHLGWRSIFLVNVPVGLVVVLLTLRYVAESRDERPRTLDLAGQVLFMVDRRRVRLRGDRRPEARLDVAADPRAVRGGRGRRLPRSSPSSADPPTR